MSMIFLVLVVPGVVFFLMAAVGHLTVFFHLSRLRALRGRVDDDEYCELVRVPLVWRRRFTILFIVAIFDFAVAYALYLFLANSNPANLS